MALAVAETGGGFKQSLRRDETVLGRALPVFLAHLLLAVLGVGEELAVLGVRHEVEVFEGKLA